VKLSTKKFVFLFLISGFAFLFIYNITIRSVVRLIPESGASFLGTESLAGWRSSMSTLLYPVKIVLAGPVLPLLNLPDPPPPFLVMGFAFYWTLLALAIHCLIGGIKRARRKT
jgi:hypothetical protein